MVIKIGESTQNISYQPQVFVLYQVKLLLVVSECQESRIYAKRGPTKQATKHDNAAACLYFLNYLAFLRPAAEWAVSVLPWVVSRGRSYGFLWADSIIQKCEGKKCEEG
jgi:hypothetical protein